MTESTDPIEVVETVVYPPLGENLTLEPVGPDRFHAPTPGGSFGRLYGGLVGGQCLRAAGITAGREFLPDALAVHFLRLGTPGQPLVIDVERVRDGRSFMTRCFTASQDGDAVAVGLASFHVREPGWDWQPAAPDVSPPAGRARDPSAFNTVVVTPLDVVPAGARDEGGALRLHPVWLRMQEIAPDDDPGFHAGVLTYLSDLGLGQTARDLFDEVPAVGATLNHSIWFHRPARADRWLLLSSAADTIAGGRGLVRAALHAEDGTLLASIAQEALLRPATSRPVPPP
jgi:acyl-CoA thioesterase-2